MLDDLSLAVKRLIALGRERGYVTYDEVDALSAAHGACLELIEDLMAKLNEIGVRVVPDAEGDGRGAATPALP